MLAVAFCVVTFAAITPAIIEAFFYADDIPTRDKFCDALWMLEAGGFVQLKFAL